MLKIHCSTLSEENNFYDSDSLLKKAHEKLNQLSLLITKEIESVLPNDTEMQLVLQKLKISTVESLCKVVKQIIIKALGKNENFKSLLEETEDSNIADTEKLTLVVDKIAINNFENMIQTICYNLNCCVDKRIEFLDNSMEKIFNYECLLIHNQIMSSKDIDLNQLKGINLSEIIKEKVLENKNIKDFFEQFIEMKGNLKKITIKDFFEQFIEMKENLKKITIKDFEKRKDEMYSDLKEKFREIIHENDTYQNIKDEVLQYLPEIAQEEELNIDEEKEALQYLPEISQEEELNIDEEETGKIVFYKERRHSV